MDYFTTITKKGQITIPKKLRKALGFEQFLKVAIEVEKDEKVIKVRPVFDILDIAGDFAIQKKGSVLKARKEMEKTYKRF